jgi:hypothetical protein
MAYLTNSCPVDVTESSGSAARRPTSVRRARERAGELLNERVKIDDVGARKNGRNGVRAGIMGYPGPSDCDMC